MLNGLTARTSRLRAPRESTGNRESKPAAICHEQFTDYNDLVERYPQSNRVLTVLILQFDLLPAQTGDRAVVTCRILT